MTDLLARLREKFRSRAATDLAHLQNLRRPGADPATIQDLAHNLSGAAGIFGYPALSAAARAVDDICQAGRPVGAAQLDALERALAEALAG